MSLLAAIEFLKLLRLIFLVCRSSSIRGSFSQVLLAFGFAFFCVASGQIPAAGCAVDDVFVHRKVAGKSGFLAVPCLRVLWTHLLQFFSLLSGGFPGGCGESGVCEEAVRCFWCGKQIF